MAGELLLVFTQISSREPDREFVLGVRVPDSNNFEGAGPGRLCAADAAQPKSLHPQRPLAIARTQERAGCRSE